MHRKKRDFLRELVIQHHKYIAIGVGVLALVIVIAQCVYPADRMPLFASVDGQDVSGWYKKDAIWQLDELANSQRAQITLGDTGQVRKDVSYSAIGLKVSNKERIQSADYPWYIRLIPGSLAWFGPVQREQAMKYTLNEKKMGEYVSSLVGKDCMIAPKNATLQLKESELTVVPATLGGTCKSDRVMAAFKGVDPRMRTGLSIELPITAKKSAVDNESAEELATVLNKNSKDGVKIAAANKQLTIEPKEVLSWLTFQEKAKKLTFTVSAEKAKKYLDKHIAPLIAKPAGVTKVSTLDFTETSRLSGPDGQALAVSTTLGEVGKVLEGTKQTATALATKVPAKIVYTRSYTKTSTGIAAQIQFFDQDNAGDFGVSFIELGGRGLSAQHNGSRQFVTASTYKLFVAFSTLRKVDAGKMKWSDANIANGRNLSTCFDDMIVKSDNACAEALIKKVGPKQLNDDIKLAGLSGSSGFFADNNKTTANDLSIYLTKLQTNKLPIKSESRNRLLDAMKRNIYRRGVPAGASGQVADKVGFMWGLLHDASIVYSPKGTYVLVVMSDGSTWEKIAELTRKIEALR